MIWSDLQDDFCSHLSADYSFHSQQAGKSFKFAIQIYPKGNSKKGTSVNDVGVYLVNKNLENVGVSASIYLANQVHKKEFSAVVKANGGRGFPSFLSRETLADNKSSYLPAGHLDIICRFTFYVYKNMKPVGDVALFSKEPLKISMERLLCDTTLSDIIITSGNESFPCHRSILANRYFFTPPKVFSTWPCTFFRPCTNGIARIILSTLGENKSLLCLVLSNQ